MKKEERNLIISAIVGVFGTLIIVLICTGFLGCEDSKGEKKTKWEWVAESWKCEDCRARFSEHEHFRTHKCSKIFSEETDRKLKRLANDLERYGINYPKEPNEIWGQGEPTAEHQKFFGNGNLSRLCFVQTQTINRQGQALAELALRVRNLEDPNEPKENKTPDKPR